MHKYHFDFTPPRPAKLRQRWLGTRKKSQGYQDHHSLSCSSKDFNFKAFATEKNQVPQLPRITHTFHQLWPHRCLSSPAHSCPSPSLLLPLPCPTQEPRTHPSHQSTPLAARLQDAVWTHVADLSRHMPAKGRTSSSALACHWHRSSAPTVPRMPRADYAATEKSCPQAGPPQLPVGGHWPARRAHLQLAPPALHPHILDQPQSRALTVTHLKQDCSHGSVSWQPRFPRASVHPQMSPTLPAYPGIHPTCVSGTSPATIKVPVASLSCDWACAQHHLEPLPPSALDPCPGPEGTSEAQSPRSLDRSLQR